MKRSDLSPFALFYTAFTAALLVFAGCRNVENQKSILTSEMPLDSCAQSLDSLQPKSDAPRLRSTDLTSGQYDYSSGEIFLEVPVNKEAPTRAHAVERVTKLPNGSYQVKLQLLCQENVSKDAADNFMFEANSPRTLRVREKDTIIDTAFRTAAMQAIQGSVNYHFKDAPALMNQPRAELERELAKLFDEQYFLRPSAGVFQFIGKKNLENGGGKMVIRVTYAKSEGSLFEDGLFFDPIPDGIFDL